jgi:hypothetical protein
VLRNGVRAYTLPIARYNSAAHVLGVVWHEREAGTTGNPAITDTVYAYYDGQQWQAAAPTLINNPFANVDNFQPALENSAATGNVLIVWYDSGSDPLRYRTLWGLRSYTGQFLYAGSGGFLSRPGDLPGLAKIGDYQDIVSVPNGPYGGRFVHAWVGVPASPHQADVYLWDTTE